LPPSLPVIHSGRRKYKEIPPLSGTVPVMAGPGTVLAGEMAVKTTKLPTNFFY